jgi:hypothetical protein
MIKKSGILLLYERILQIEGTLDTKKSEKHRTVKIKNIFLVAVRKCARAIMSTTYIYNK